MPAGVNDGDYISATTKVLDTPASPFARRGWAPTTPFHGETSETRAVTTPSYGTTSTFRITNNRDFLGQMVLEWTDTAGTVNSGAPARRNYFGFLAIARAEVKHTSDTLDVINGEQLHLIHRLWDDSHEVAATERLVENETLATRQSTFTSARTYRVPLRFYWTYDTGVYMSAMNLGRDLEVLITFRPKNELFVFAGDAVNYATNSISGCKLITMDYHVARQERSAGVKDHKESGGITQLMTEMLDQRVAITGDGTQTEFLIKLDAYRHPVRELVFRVRKQADVADDTDRFWEFEEVEEFSIISGNDSLVPVQNGDFNRFFYQRVFHSGECSDAIYIASFAMAPQLPYDQTGSRDFASQTNLQLKVKMKTAPGNGVVLYVDTTGFLHNMVQHKGSTLRRQFR